MPSWRRGQRAGTRKRSDREGARSLAVGVGRHARTGGGLLGPDDGRAAVGLVLLHHEGIDGLLPALRGEAQLAAGENRLDLERGQLLAHLLVVERAGLLDAEKESAGRL